MSHDQPQAWRTVTIEDLGQVVTGRTPPSSKPEMFGSLYPFITPSDMRFGLRRVTTERSISLVGSLALSRIKLPPKSVAFVCIGATIGKVCLTSEDSFTNQQINSIVVDCDRHSPDFVYYLMLGMADKVKALAGGAATPIVNKSSFCGISVSIPPIDIQSKIAFTLSAYDDLIENNTRRIEILEEMARRLYEEWFVQFRFPGHEEVGFKESELGLIPEGWDLVPLGDIYRTGSGGTPSRKKPEFYGGDYRWVKTKELQDCPVFDTEERISEEGLKKSSAKLFPRNTVLIAMYGATIGRLGVLQEESATNQACCAILPNSQGCGWGYAYLSLFSRRQALIDLRAGAAQQNISQDVIKRFRLLRASDELHNQFEMAVTPFLTLCFALYRKIANLRAQRDLLLPKLISGEIDVSDIPMPT
ncbi:restriction endonuclease subunit S [Pseudomonas savastanoi]|uniref:restriction endonuclease subunit S n=1 Tax=Pseudomonas savastanoi TaxID=29438 RepID=UPI001E334846|nr:restriction endonuclease subunit S [Pseudomonas savastanoi]UFI44222.1 restriction endonuclease subunit S [Pseudomonas savastanoi]